MRANAAQGVRRYFITDDNFARNKNWEAILDRIIELREHEGFKIHLNMQVDTQVPQIPHFVEKAARAGCTKVFIGLENINPENLRGRLEGAEPDHRVPRHAAGVARAPGCSPSPATSSAFPRDTPESIARDIGIIQRELPIDMLEFFILTPLPGSQDHQELSPAGRPDGRRHEQLRQRARHDGASAHEPHGSGSRSTSAPGTSTTRGSTSRRSSGAASPAHPSLARLLTMIFIFARHPALLPRASAPGGPLPPQAPPRPPPRPSARSRRSPSTRGDCSEIARVRARSLVPLAACGGCRRRVEREAARRTYTDAASPRPPTTATRRSSCTRRRRPPATPSPAPAPAYRSRRGAAPRATDVPPGDGGSTLPLP